MFYQQRINFNNFKSEEHGQHKIHYHVPWFSWNEWEEVYQRIFETDDKNQWQLALDQILVWKSRVQRIAVGIEGTLPLLQAKIALCDPLMSSVNKSSLLTLAILKFVSITLKGYEHQTHSRLALFSLAEKINLPSYLVSLRNEIIHSDNIFGDLETLRSALNVSLHWVNEYYWRREHKKASDRINLQKRHFEKRITKAARSPNISKDDRKIIKLFNGTILSLVGHIKNKIPIFQLLKNAIGLIEGCYAVAPDQCMDCLVKLFYHQDLYKQIASDASFKKAECNCPGAFVICPDLLVLQPLIDHICEKKLLVHFLKSLINSSEGETNFGQYWLGVIFNSFLEDYEDQCTVHRFSCESGILSTGEWKQLLIHLFNRGSKWSSSLALKLSRSDTIGLSPHQRSLLTEFEALTTETKELSLTAAAEEDSDKDVEENCLALLQNHVGDEAAELLCIDTNPKKSINLGYLPHQKEDSDFYKKLILVIPTEEKSDLQPPSKKIKKS